MPTSYIAAKTAADETGAEITVGSSPLGISCFGAHGSELVGKVMQKNSDSSFTPLKSAFDPSKAPHDVTLTGIQAALSIDKPGVYKIYKVATTGVAGIDTDEV